MDGRMANERDDQRGGGRETWILGLDLDWAANNQQTVNTEREVPRRDGNSQWVPVRCGKRAWQTK